MARRNPCSLVPAFVIGAASMLAPLVIHADEVVMPGAMPAAEPVAPSVPRFDARPFGMAGLDASTSVGLGATGGWAQTDGGNGELLGELALDAELTLGRHAKLFASVPFSLVKNDESTGRGHGNLTLGGMLMGGHASLTAAIGLSTSFGGSEEGGYGLYLRYDLSKYASSGVTFADNDERVARGFSGLRLEDRRGFVQLQADYYLWNYSQGETGWGIQQFGAVTLGGGVPLDSGTWLIGDLGVLHYFGSTGTSDETRLVADAGLRWRLSPGSRATWGARASFLYDDDFATVSLGFELRADFLDLG